MSLSLGKYKTEIPAVLSKTENKTGSIFRKDRDSNV